jgi:Mg2+ and Co2+ transporter CorA
LAEDQHVPSKTKLSGRLYDATRSDEDLEVRVGMVKPSEKQLLWIDVGRDPADLALVDKALGLKGAVASLEKPSLRARITNAKTFARIRATGILSGKKVPTPVSVDILAIKNVVVTVHDGEVEGLSLPLDFAPDETQLGYLDEAAFTALMLDGMLTGFFRAVEAVEKQIDEYDTRALQTRKEEELIANLVELRGQIAMLRRALNPQREIFVALERPGLVMNDSEQAGWPLLADRFTQAIEAVENARELLLGCFDILISRSGQRTNNIMKVLTVVSSVLLPAVVIAGIMGMNFKAPLFDEPNNFYIVIGATVVLAISILLVARWRRWV